MILNGSRNGIFDIFDVFDIFDLFNIHKKFKGGVRVFRREKPHFYEFFSEIRMK